MDQSLPSFDAFVQKHTRGLLRTACLITWDDDEAEDLVQECLFQVSRRWRRVAAMDQPVAYARRVLINLALGGRRPRSRRRRELDRAPQDPGHDSATASIVDPAAEAQLATIGDRAELLAALGRLSPQQRTVLVLRYFEDLTESQVADLLGCTVGTVKTSGSRGLARLRDLLSTSTSTVEVCDQ